MINIQALAALLGKILAYAAFGFLLYSLIFRRKKKKQTPKKNKRDWEDKNENDGDI